MQFPGPKFYSFDWISRPQPISQTTNIGAIWHNCGARSLITVGGSPQQKFNKTKIHIFQILSHFQIWKFLNSNLPDLLEFLPSDQ